MTSAKIDLKPSPLFPPVATLGNGHDFDEFDDNAKQPEKKKVETAVKPVSRTKAVVLSLLLPGAGQYYAGARGRAEVFLGAEVATWAGFLAFRTYGSWKEDDYIRYAQQHAAVDPTGKDDNFFKNLVFYDNREDYNTSGRIIEPSAPYYPPGPSYYWQWDNSNSRDAYRAMRNASKSAFRKATFMIGVAVFNRILAGIDTFRIVKKVVKQKESENEFSEKDKSKPKFSFKLKPFGRNPQIGLSVSQKF